MKNIHLDEKNEHKTVTLEIGWLDLLDVKDPAICRQRWEIWKQIAIAAKEKCLVDFWTDISACAECKHLDGDWCKKAKLPCTVTPLLTIRHGMIGMACMGMYYERLQREFDFEFEEGEHASGKCS